MRRKTLWAVAVAVVLVAVSLPVAWKVFGWSGRPVTQEDGRPAPIQTADVTASGPGSLVSAETMPGLARAPGEEELQSARVVYRSTSGDTGLETLVSGSVFTPLGPAPAGGWPVIALGHGTTGIDEPCAPSLSNTLLGFESLVAGYAKGGYAVAFADYQGLGSSGVHPYADARTAGLNMIDAVRALRLTFPDVSDRWAAMGGSQGGGAAWAADEQAASYAPELDLVGSVAQVPAADVSGIVDKALAGTMTADQRGVFIAIVESLARLHDDVNRDDYRRGAAAEYWDVLIACSGPKGVERNRAAGALQPGDVTVATPAAANRLRDLLQAWALPQRPLSAPLSVVYGGRDTFIDEQWTTDAIVRACGLGGTVVWQLQPDKGHGEVDITDQYQWIADRFAGRPVSNECQEGS